MPPKLEILQDQPRWAWFMLWGDPGVLGREGPAMRPLYDSEQVLTMAKLPWVQVKQPKLHYPVIR